MALVMSGPCGGMGGNAFSSPMDPNTNLLVVRVWVQEDCIGGMQICYELNGSIYDSEIWGNPGGTLNEVDLKDGEFMGSISGTVGQQNDGIVVVRSIAFTTNSTTYGPYGPWGDADHPFNLSAGNDGKIAGFYGYSGWLVDAIGVLVKPNRLLVKEGPCGGAGGDPFSMDMNADTTLLGVRIWARDDCIAGIQVHYRIDGQEDQWTPVWGSRDGTLYEISFEDRSLQSIRGYMGLGNWDIFVVTALSFVTDDGTTYGPYGNETGAPFAFEAGNVGKIVGIHGRCGGLIDAIGVIMLN